MSPRARHSLNGAMRVLVVDDEESLRNVVRKTLESEGLSVVTAADAETALMLVRASPPSLVIADVFLPEMSGIELLEEIRREVPRVPVVLMSGGGEHKNLAPLEAGRFLGASASIAKPFRPAQLVALVHKILNRD